MKLTIELVPRTSWYSNVRSNVSPSEWDKLRKSSYAAAGYKCEICGGKGKKHPVECHEEWEYVIEDEERIQRLVKLLSLCPDCHKVKHPGLAQINGQIHIVLKQLMKVNGMSHDRASAYIDEAFMLWDERSAYDWRLDIDLIK